MRFGVRARVTGCEDDQGRDWVGARGDLGACFWGLGG